MQLTVIYANQKILYKFLCSKTRQINKAKLMLGVLFKQIETKN